MMQHVHTLKIYSFKAFFFKFLALILLCKLAEKIFFKKGKSQKKGIKNYLGQSLKHDKRSFGVPVFLDHFHIVIYLWRAWNMDCGLDYGILTFFILLYSIFYLWSTLLASQKFRFNLAFLQLWCAIRMNINFTYPTSEALSCVSCI